MKESKKVRKHLEFKFTDHKTDIFSDAIGVSKKEMEAFYSVLEPFFNTTKGSQLVDNLYNSDLTKEELCFVFVVCHVTAKRLELEAVLESFRKSSEVE